MPCATSWIRACGRLPISEAALGRTPTRSAPGAVGSVGKGRRVSITVIKRRSHFRVLAQADPTHWRDRLHRLLADRAGRIVGHSCTFPDVQHLTALAAPAVMRGGAGRAARQEARCDGGRDASCSVHTALSVSTSPCYAELTVASFLYLSMLCLASGLPTATETSRSMLPFQARDLNRLKRGGRPIVPVRDSRPLPRSLPVLLSASRIGQSIARYRRSGHGDGV